MPHLSQENVLLVMAVEAWMETAAEEVEDIGAWRIVTDDPPDPMSDIVYERLVSGGGWCQPKDLYKNTAFLVRRITANLKHFDPTPLQDIYEAIARWHLDHNAGKIPDQDSLSLTLDRSMQMLLAIKGSVMAASQKVVEVKHNHSDDATSNTRGGRPKDGRIAKRNRRIRQLCKQHKLKGKWAKLAKIANADKEIQSLDLKKSLNRDIVRNILHPSKKRRG